MYTDFRDLEYHFMNHDQRFPYICTVLMFLLGGMVVYCLCMVVHTHIQAHHTGLLPGQYLYCPNHFLGNKCIAFAQRGAW